jgi:hypothetical protein
MWRSISVAVGVTAGTEWAPSSAVRRTQESLGTLQSVYSRVGSGLLRSRCLLGCIMFDTPARLLSAASDD